MDTCATLIAHGQSTKPVQPGEGALDDPARAPETAAMVGAALGELGANAPAVERLAMRLRVVAAVALDQAGLRTGRPGRPRRGGNGVDEGEQLGDVVAIGGRQRRDERNPVRVGENMMLRPGFAAIGRVRSSFFPPRSARSEELSTTARAKSRSPRRWSSASNTACRRFHTPARCQRTSRRQQVVPEPQPISRGSMFHGSPLRRTNRMPVSAARSGIGFRPAYRRLRGRRFGSSGSISAHKSSSIANLAMRDGLRSRRATVPSW